MAMREPSTFEKFKMGAIMGGTVGLCMGLIIGTVNVIRYGPGQHGYLGTVGRFMGSSGAFFGLIMSVGSVLRSEGALPPHQQKLLLQQLDANQAIRYGRWERRADGTWERSYTLQSDGSRRVMTSEAVPLNSEL